MTEAADAHKQAVLGEVERAIDLTKDGRYSDALEIFEQLLPQLSSQDVNDKRVLSNSSSFYGLCVAMVRRRYAEAVQYCNLSLKSQFMDPEHLANLALVYLERNDRASAIENLHKGLRIQPKHPRINKILDDIGRRKPPPITFLSRSNPLNIWFGKRRKNPSK
jgi:tetratricopeptide (TPR) repeat protein